MLFHNLKETIQYRITANPNECFVEEYWKAATAIFSKDISATISYIYDDCTDEELYWLSEIFEEIIEKTNSEKIIEALEIRLNKICKEDYYQTQFISEHLREHLDYDDFIASIREEIEYAKNKIK